MITTPDSVARGADQQLDEMIQRILTVGNPDKIVLFGSRARGEANPDSDYDLLLIETSTLPRYKRAARYRRALIGTAPSKDVLVWTPAEVEKWSGVPNAFITTVLREGVVLYDRQEGVIVVVADLLPPEQRPDVFINHET